MSIRQDYEEVRVLINLADEIENNARSGKESDAGHKLEYVRHRLLRKTMEINQNLDKEVEKLKR